jgi:hypothetical protein
MESNTKSAPVSKPVFWASVVISAVPVLLLLFSAVMKLMKPQMVVDGFAHLGWPESMTPVLAALELSCTAIYLIPRTAVLGAILLTGFLGGAIATHLRIGEPVYVQAGLGVLVWLGLFLREPRLRALIPWRS